MKERMASVATQDYATACARAARSLQHQRQQLLLLQRLLSATNVLPDIVVPTWRLLSAKDGGDFKTSSAK
jgi:hypothetical protein